MAGISRRGFVKMAGAGAAMAAAGWQVPAWAQGATAPRKGGVLTATIGFPEPHTMFAPAGGGGSPAFTAARVLETLVRIAPDLSVSPHLATAWAVDPDHQRYKVTVRQGVKWHDGKDFTAADVAFTIGEYWKQIAAGGALTALKRAYASSAQEVTVEFDKPIPEFTFLYALGTLNVIPAHIYGKGDLNTNPANNAPVGTGPYRFQRWVRGSRAEFERNAQYWQPSLPNPDRLVVRWWREPSARAAALEAGELDIGVQNPVPFADIKRLRDSGKFLVSDKNYEISDWDATLVFNAKNPITQHQAVRQAILHTLDLKYIADVIYQGFATPARSIIGSHNTLYYNPDVPQYPFDKARAEKLLDEAGFPRKEGGKRFAVRLVAAGWVDENGKLGAYIRQALQDIGVDVELRVPDRAGSLKAIYTDYDFDLAITNAGSPAEPVPGTTQLFTSEGIARGLAFRNASQWSDPKFDALVDKITFEIDAAKRKQLIHDYAVQAATAATNVRLVEVKQLTVARSVVQGLPNVADIKRDSWDSIWLSA
ncbi:ABC transporter substrate-binding protein [Bordetella sp. N]|uniref:ABC transporter substrate-binding protein n=1 Tax=Bordetella sp. N TaxID=1746199 RepID=UPI000710F4F0|nr:ABC transporter substrate-binding protein [Bordetella sp. N]ALM82278.1 hypothetical protein ASB57_04255 [Bordetella sp. N]